MGSGVWRGAVAKGFLIVPASGDQFPQQFVGGCRVGSLAPSMCTIIIENVILDLLNAFGAQQRSRGLSAGRRSEKLFHAFHSRARHPQHCSGEIPAWSIGSGHGWRRQTAQTGLATDVGLPPSDRIDHGRQGRHELHPMG